MTEQEFENLTNLYLDNEIGRSELRLLKRAVKENLMLRRRFERACKIHQAARQALAAKTAKTGIALSAQADSQIEEPRRVKHRGSSSTVSALPGVKLHENQRQARINATVASLSERQATKGAAATLRLDSLGRSKSRGSGGSGGSSAGSSSPGGNLDFGNFIKFGLAGLMGAGMLYISWHYLNTTDEGATSDINSIPLHTARSASLPELVPTGSSPIAQLLVTLPAAPRTPAGDLPGLDSPDATAAAGGMSPTNPAGVPNPGLGMAVPPPVPVTLDPIGGSGLGGAPLAMPPAEAPSPTVAPVLPLLGSPMVPAGNTTAGR